MDRQFAMTEGFISEWASHQKKVLELQEKQVTQLQEKQAQA
jgi:hypothetical protein